MDKPKGLNSLFKEKIFRIPDYQRGYAWQRDQLTAFWEDLVNLAYGRSHYTGVLTLKSIPNKDIREDAREYWLLDDHAYTVFHVVDGQQRLTTVVIFLQAFVDFLKSLPENQKKPESEIFFTDSLSVADIVERFLFKVKRGGDRFRTYKFGYTEDNPSYEYLRFKILGEYGGGAVQETFYTLNLANAKHYFSKQIQAVYETAGIAGLQEIYGKLTKSFLFNEYIIEDEFDVFVAFETMNNRGKRLSDLELLKNRLIYLVTMYGDTELDAAARRSMRETVNEGWKEIYKQLGSNKLKPLNDDDFLKAHWILFYKYSRKTGRDYIRFLLDEKFTPKRIYNKVEREIDWELPEEQRSDLEETDLLPEGEQDESGIDTPTHVQADLSPIEVKNYVLSLKECAGHWFTSFFPDLTSDRSAEERRWLEALNRIGFAYFRPLVMSVLKNVDEEMDRIRVFRGIERFIFVAFRLNAVRANYRSSEFYNLTRALDRGEQNVEYILERLDENLAYAFDEKGCFRTDSFYGILYRKLRDGSGYHGWAGLRYFLYEYEISLLAESRQKKVDWDDLLKQGRDMISIEHIYPQTPVADWEDEFAGVPKEERGRYKGSLGNMLVLSKAINSALQNDTFKNKKYAKFDENGRKVRNGYEDGSHSEIEVSRSLTWGPAEIQERGMRLLLFMEDRWRIPLKDDSVRKHLLYMKPSE